MAINAFTGGPGTGKTYGVIEHVILPALMKGRSILTNIEGLNIDAIYQYVHDTSPTGKVICIGTLRACPRHAPADAKFFPGIDHLDKPAPYPDFSVTTVSPGDLVVIDEASRYWPAGSKVLAGHTLFFREHRHFANEYGDTCDLVIIDPDISLICRALKGKIEMTSATHKLKDLGSNRYVVKLFRGFKLYKPVQTLGPLAFKEKIFTLYKSYSHAKAKEQSIDSRQNIFTNKMFWLFALMAFVFIGAGLSYLFYFFSPSSHNLKTADSSSLVSSSASVSSPSLSSNSASVSASPVQIERFSDRYRLAGSVTINGLEWAVVVDSTGFLRFENPNNFYGRSPISVGTVDGSKVTRWTGVPSSSQTSSIFPSGGQK